MWLSALLARRSRGYCDLIFNSGRDRRGKTDPELLSVEPDSSVLHDWRELQKSSAEQFLKNPSGGIELYVNGSFIEEQRNIDLLEVCFLTDFNEESGQPGASGQGWIDAINNTYKEFRDFVKPQHRNLASFYQWAIGSKNPFLMTVSNRQHDLFGAGPSQVFMGERHFIGVDLNTSDTILMAEFKDWLKKKRMETRISTFREVTVENLRRFSNLNLLPYLDLHFWEIANEVKIPDSKIIATLGISTNQDQYVKNVLRREAIQMIDDSTFFAIRGLAWKQAQEEDQDN